jgi:hypothetical protein
MPRIISKQYLLVLNQVLEHTGHLLQHMEMSVVK